MPPFIGFIYLFMPPVLIFREQVLDLRDISVCAVEITMYAYWRCINIDRKDDPA